MPGESVGTYGVSDYSSAGVVSVVHPRSGMSETFQLVLVPPSGMLAVSGVVLTAISSITPDTGALTLAGIAPSVS